MRISAHFDYLLSPGQVKRLTRIVHKIGRLTCSNRRFRAARRLMLAMGGPAPFPHTIFETITWSGKTVEYGLWLNHHDYLGCALYLDKTDYRQPCGREDSVLAQCTVLV